MTRISLSLDSASAAEAEAFVYAYQRATEGQQVVLPGGYIAWPEPTVKMMGKWGVTTPPVDVETAARIMRDFAPAHPEIGEIVARPPRPCEACGAESREPCRPGCIGEAAEQDRIAEEEFGLDDCVNWADPYADCSGRIWRQSDGLVRCEHCANVRRVTHGDTPVSR